jgi:hypothetical protein
MPVWRVERALGEEAAAGAVAAGGKCRSTSQPNSSFRIVFKSPVSIVGATYMRVCYNNSMSKCSLRNSQASHVIAFHELQPDIALPPPLAKMLHNDVKKNKRSSNPFAFLVPKCVCGGKGGGPYILNCHNNSMNNDKIAHTFCWMQTST